MQFPLVTEQTAVASRWDTLIRWWNDHNNGVRTWDNVKTTNLTATNATITNLLGRVAQIVAGTPTSTNTTSNSTTYADATNLNVSITPISATSTILVFASVNGLAGNALNGKCSLGLRIVRGASTVIKTFPQALAVGGTTAPADNTWEQIFLFTTDAPATTSATTYKIQLNNDAGATSAVNDATIATPNSQMWAIEVS